MNDHRIPRTIENAQSQGCPIQAFFRLEWGRWLKRTTIFLLIMVISLPLLAQPRPRIDFDHLLRVFPDLPWDFEIRYVVHDGLSTDMLRLYYDGRADLVRWRPDDPGSLAEVCHGTIEDRQFRHLLELLRDKNFNDLPSDTDPLRTVANHSDATISVRVGKATVRKLDRHEHDNPALTAIEDELDSLQKSLTADQKTKCDMESVPARP